MTFQCPSQAKAFRDLWDIFSNRDNRALEFEILPPALGPLLHDEDSIGITKKHLVEAFVAARQVFFQGKNPNVKHKGPSSTPSTDSTLDNALLVSSEIILLFDCEHLTACNWRKTRLASLVHSGSATLRHALDTELSLTSTYLCSPLHRHTKSPTLWQHRRWVLTRILQLKAYELGDVRELFKAELNIVLRAGELHPRNYYAFSYMRQIHSDLSGLGDNEFKAWFSCLAQDVSEITLDWCLTHPTDISGWMYTLSLLEAVEDLDVHLNAVSKVVRFALEIGWEGESLWTFVDLAATAFHLVDSTRKGMPITSLDVLVDSVLLERLRQNSSGPGCRWKIWMNRARVYWATTGQHSNKSDAA